MEELSYKSISAKSKTTAIVSVMMGSALISLGPFFIEFSSLNAMTSSFYRMLIGGIAFFIIALIRKDKLPDKRVLGLCLLAGITLGLDLVTWNQSVRYIGAGLSTVLANLEIIFLVLISYFFLGERISSLFLKMCLLICVGICFLIHPYFSHMDFSHSLGIFFGLGASLVYSIYLFLLKMIGAKNPKLSSISILSSICLLGALILGIVMIINPKASFVIKDLPSFYCVIANSVLSQIAGWWLITKGIRSISLSLSGILLLVQPALTFILDCLFLGRNTDCLQLFGCFILLTAVYATMKKEKEKEVIV